MGLQGEPESAAAPHHCGAAKDVERDDDDAGAIDVVAQSWERAELELLEWDHEDIAYIDCKDSTQEDREVDGGFFGTHLSLANC